MNGPSRVSETVRVLTLAYGRKDDTLERLLIKAVDPRDYVDHDDWHQEALDYLNGRLAFDGLRLEKNGIKVRLVTTTGTSARGVQPTGANNARNWSERTGWDGNCWWKSRLARGLVRQTVATRVRTVVDGE